jgi:hypothetical protein
VTGDDVAVDGLEDDEEEQDVDFMMILCYAMVNGYIRLGSYYRSVAV